MDRLQIKLGLCLAANLYLRPLYYPNFSLVNHYQNPNVLNIPGYEVYFTRYADAILQEKFPDARQDLETVFTQFRFAENKIIGGGGRMSEITKSLGALLVNEHWKPQTRKTELFLEGRSMSRETIKLDHLRTFRGTDLAVKILWNSKDSLFDKYLDDFRKLHHAGGLAIGIMVTRGKTLREDMFFVYQRFLQTQLPLNVEKLKGPLTLSQKHYEEIADMIEAQGDGAINSIANLMTGSKFGTTTTHIEKLIDKLDGRAGDPCPLILIGIGKDRLLS